MSESNVNEQFNVSEQMEKLNSFREKAGDLSTDKVRLETELKSFRTQLSDLQAQSKETFDCEIKELPKLENELINSAKEMVAEIEELLGTNEAEEDEDEFEALE